MNIVCVGLIEIGCRNETLYYLRWLKIWVAEGPSASGLAGSRGPWEVDRRASPRPWTPLAFVMVSFSGPLSLREDREGLRPSRACLLLVSGPGEVIPAQVLE